MSRLAVQPGSFLLGVTTALIVALSTPSWCWAQGQPAVVEGTTQLFIRRGPGPEFPPFATLTGGSQVQVQERRGTWARVTTASGQVGYVHTKFLRLVEAAAKDTATANPTAPETPTLTRARSSPTSAKPTRTRRRRPTETAAPSEETPATEVAVDTPSPTPTEIPETLSRASSRSSRGAQREIERLSEAVENLNRRLDQRFPAPEAATTNMSEDTGVSGGAILLGLVGLVIGWLLGATYQRNKERGRRSRIRL